MLNHFVGAPHYDKMPCRDMLWKHMMKQWNTQKPGISGLPKGTQKGSLSAVLQLNACCLSVALCIDPVPPLGLEGLLRGLVVHPR